MGLRLVADVENNSFTSTDERNKAMLGISILTQISTN